MENIRHALTIPLGLIALFFVYIGLRRGIRFHFHDYQGNRKERLRDNFLATFTIITSIDCFLLLRTSTDLWVFIFPIMLLLILFSPISMVGEYWSSYLGDAMTGRKNQNDWLFWQAGTPKWYEFTPFAFVAGWVIFCLALTSFSLSIGTGIFAENIPDQIVFTALMFDLTATSVITIWLHWRLAVPSNN